METITYSIKIADNPNLIEDDKKLKPPIDLDYFPNQMGINLCSVKEMVWTEREDGQLVDVHIEFIPDEDYDLQAGIDNHVFQQSTTGHLKLGQ